MECLELLQDLEVMSTQLKIPILKHMFTHFSPSQSKDYRACVTGFRLKDYESADYRSAYHQLCDWFYGWNISDTATELLEEVSNKGLSENDAASLNSGRSSATNTRGGGLATPSDEFMIRRVPRKIDLKVATEKQECLRIYEAFSTLQNITQRKLKKCFIEIDDQMASIGKNEHSSRRKKAGQFLFQTNSFQDGGGVDDNDDGDDDGVREENMKWGEEKSSDDESKGVGGVLGDGSPSTSPSSSPTPGMGMTPKQNLSSSRRNGRQLGSSASEPNSVPDGTNSRQSSSKHGPLRQRNSLVSGKQGTSTPSAEVASTPHPPSSSSNRFSTRKSLPDTPTSNSAKPRSGTGTGTGMEGSNANEALKKHGDQENFIRSSAESRSSGSGHSQGHSSSHFTTSTLQSPHTPSSYSNGNRFSFPMSNHSVKEEIEEEEDEDESGTKVKKDGQRGKKKRNQRQLTPEEIIIRDIDNAYLVLDSSIDYTIICLANCILLLAFSEALENKETFSKQMQNAHELANNFIPNTVGVIWHLLQRDLPEEAASFLPIRNSATLQSLVNQVLVKRNFKSSNQNFYTLSRLHYKVALINELFAGLDIFLFPKFVNAHREGAKCLKTASFDSKLWLTGGYDGTVRIFDLEADTCLAQFVGHKSIVTDVHFTKNDLHIVSASFDRTIKIWNAQNAACEKTLSGHQDSITSCDLSPDGRYIISGGLDNTIRLWDFHSGECMAVVKKHQRYVKAVKFTLDGRYVASAGLDRRVYIWDVKLLAYSKNHSHVRCIEAHDDYVLALDVQRPNLLLTCSRDQTVKLWDYVTGHLLHYISLSPTWACSVAFSSDGEVFATGSFDNSILLFKTKTGEKMRQMRVFNMGIMSVKFPKNYNFIVCGSREGLVQWIPL